jgi:site-specific recombinase XerD
MMVKTLSAFVQSFLAVALPQRGVSPLTVLSYRDAIKLLLRFIADQKGCAVVRLEIANLDAPAVQGFLDDLEQTRGNEITTRNNRLAAIRSFFTFVAAEEPSLLDHCQRICSIPLKRAPTRTVPYLERDEMQALLAAPDRSTAAGRRDYTLLLSLYNTGARVHEITHVRAADLTLARPPQILLRGKGNKERICPLWASTARALHELLDDHGIPLNADRILFLNTQGGPLTRFGVDYILKKYASLASSTVPSIVKKPVSPHIIRHTSAVHMLNAGVDINVIRSWLGHVDLRTTSIYTEIDLSTKRKAIETCAPDGERHRRTRPSWRSNEDLLVWLEHL